MAVLNAWQRLDRVLPGQPFGDGIDGAYSSATIPTVVSRSCSGSADGTTLTLGSSGFSNGDVILIHQTRGTGAGQWEINRVSSGGGSTSITTQAPLKYTYTDSGSSQAQVVKVFRYTTVTAQSGTWDVVDWDGDKGGLLAFASKISTTVTGTINANDAGFRGGAGAGGAGQSNVTAYCGEGSSGASAQQTGANGSGGGGSREPSPGDGQYASGGGGGNGASGSTGENNGATAGTGGSSTGSSDLTSFFFGGGGGGMAVSDSGNNNAQQGNGGDGGGGVVIFSKTITITGGITSTGAQGVTTIISPSTTVGSGAAGAGGSIMIACQTATLGSGLIVATGGSQKSQGIDGGAGGTGRIAIHHSGTITGTSSPTFTDVSDPLLQETGGGIIAALFL